MKTIVSTPKAPKAIGPYSQAVKVDAGKQMLFVSGQIPLDPQTGELVANDITAQTTQALKNLEAVVLAAGMSLKDVVKTTVLLSDMADFQGMNSVYTQFFTEDFPARAAFAVKTLPKNALVEIEAVAVS